MAREGDDAAPTFLNAAPVTMGEACATGFGAALVVSSFGGLLANGNDAGGDPVTLVAVSATGKGVLAVEPDGALTFTPNAGGIRTETISDTVSGRFTASTTTRTIEIEAPMVNVSMGADRRDDLVGTTGPDRLIAMAGAGAGDRLTGGVGADKVIYWLGTSSNGKRETKAILDFEVGVNRWGLFTRGASGGSVATRIDRDGALRLTRAHSSHHASRNTAGLRARRLGCDPPLHNPEARPTLITQRRR